MEEVGQDRPTPVRPILPLPGEVGLEGGEVEEREGAEEREVTMRKPPKGPTEQMKAAHRKTHLPFRPWCPVCVEGRGRDWPHLRATGEEEEEFPKVCFDYCFMRDEQGGPSAPVIVGKFKGVGAILAHVVPQKGAGLDWTIKQVCRDLVKFGIGGKVILKSDQEPSLVSLIEGVIKMRGAELTVPEYSPVGDSQANGQAERGVQTIEGLTRTHKIGLEEKLGKKIPVESAVFSWLVEHCADLHNKFHVFADGQTSYEKVKGRAYKGEMLEFGQMVLHRVPGKTQGGLMAPRWTPGVWLGKRFSSEEHVVSAEGGRVVRTRAVRSLPEASMWQAECIDEVKGVPWKPAGENTVESERLPDVPRAVEIRAEEPRPEPKVRAMKIMPRHLDKFKYSTGCPKCAAMQRGQTTDTVSLGHSAACRKRLEEEMMKDENAKKEVIKASERKDGYLSRKVEDYTKEEDAKKRRTGEDETQGASSSSSGGQTHVPRAEEVQVPDDDGDLELEDAEAGGGIEKRKRDEGDDGGEDAPAAVYRQLPAAVEPPVGPPPLRPWMRNVSRARESDQTQEGAEKGPRLTEREAYARDLQRLRDQSEQPSMMGLTEKQWRNQGVSECDFAEIFSPPRTAERARMRGLKGGWSLDSHHIDPWSGKTWDLSQTKVQEAAKNLLRRTRPKVLVASPPCTLFSQLLNLSGGVKNQEELRKAIKLVEFAVEMCMIQHRAGRKFIFEHPAGARSWRLKCLEDLREVQGVESVVFNMCRFGMEMEDKQGKGLIYKPTRVVTNSRTIAEKVNVKCIGGHRHVHLESGRAKHAARYPEALCDAFIDGMLIEEMQRQTGDSTLWNVMACPDMCDPEEEKVIRESMEGIDDVTGERIDPVLIKKGRKEEMEGFKEFHVYDHVLRSEAEKDTEGKFIGTRWVDHNKGTRENPEVRRRLVGQEFAKGEVRDDLFAATPPLVATRMLLSRVASRGSRGPGNYRVLLLDVKKAFLYGKIRRRVYIELPAEDEMSKTGKYVGRLVKAMYGTRDAPQVWQTEVRKTMQEMGFEALVSTPCVYYHKEMDVRIVAHVDDMLCTGPKENLKKVHEDLEKKFKMKGQTLGPGPGEDREGKFLGRTIRWKDHGLEWEGDGKLREALCEEWCMEKCSAVTTPGVKEEKCVIGNEVELQDKKRVAKFRRAAARINYMALDNPKLGFASKEVSRGMAKPTEEDEKKVKRVVRYLKLEPGVVYEYRWQDMPETISCYADSDWAGCQRTRRSTSGGTVFLGKHLVAHWARTQVGIALSSGEAELNAALKVVCEAIGVEVMGRELGYELKIDAAGDSSAALGTMSRQGSGKIKHLETKQLWLQEKVLQGKVKYRKIPRAQNVADALTHYWTAGDGAVHFKSMGLRTLSPTLRST